MSEDLIRRQMRKAIEADPEAFVDNFVKYTRPEFVKWGFCPQCHKKVQVDYPDFKGYRQYMESVLNQVYGSPAERKRVEVTGRIGHYAEMSDEELMALAAEDAEVRELGPGA